MAIIATAGETYTPAPAGVHQAVCVDVIDKGMLPNSFRPGTSQHKIVLAFQIDETREDGKRFLVYKRYTCSLNEKATLRKDLESWRGRPFTRDEEMGFDVESVIGVNGQINVQHNASNGKTYANVVAVMPLAKGMAKLKPVDYVREQDRSESTPDNTPVDGDEPPF